MVIATKYNRCTDLTAAIALLKACAILMRPIACKRMRDLDPTQNILTCTHDPINIIVELSLNFDVKVARDQ